MSKDHNKFVRQTRSGRQSKKPANFDQYSASGNSCKDGFIEEDKEEYYGSYRNSQKPLKKVNYRLGHHDQQNSSERAFNRKKNKSKSKDQDEIENISNQSSESEYLTNTRQPPQKSQDKKDELLGFISSSHQTDSRKEIER